MDKKLFEQLLEQGQVKARPYGKADWEKIRKELRKDKGIHSTKEVWEDFVHKVVNRLRCKEWLHKETEEGRAVRVYRYGQYWWTFDPEIVKKVHSKKE